MTRETLTKLAKRPKTSIASLLAIIAVGGSSFLWFTGELNIFDVAFATVPVLIYAFARQTEWSIRVCGAILLAVYVLSLSTVLAGWRFAIPLFAAALFVALATSIAGAMVRQE